MNGNILKPLFLSLLLAAGGYLAYRFAGPWRAAQPQPPSPELAAAMKAADALLAAHEAERAAFRARLEAGPLRPEDFAEGGKFAVEFLAMEARFTDKFNELSLPCTECPEALRIEGYLDWSAGYAEAQLEGMKKFNKAYSDAVARALAPK